MLTNIFFMECALHKNKCYVMLCYVMCCVCDLLDYTEHWHLILHSILVVWHVMINCFIRSCVPIIEEAKIHPLPPLACHLSFEMIKVKDFCIIDSEALILPWVQLQFCFCIIRKSYLCLQMAVTDPGFAWCQRIIMGGI